VVVVNGGLPEIEHDDEETCGETEKGGRGSELKCSSSVVAISLGRYQKGVTKKVDVREEV
jgi:hypothetical protein